MHRFAVGLCTELAGGLRRFSNTTERGNFADRGGRRATLFRGSGCCSLSGTRIGSGLGDELRGRLASSRLFFLDDVLDGSAIACWVLDLDFRSFAGRLFRGLLVVTGRRCGESSVCARPLFRCDHDGNVRRIEVTRNGLGRGFVHARGSVL